MFEVRERGEGKGAFVPKKMDEDDDAAEGGRRTTETPGRLNTCNFITMFIYMSDIKYVVVDLHFFFFILLYLPLCSCCSLVILIFLKS